jgi:hypothetical protein
MERQEMKQQASSAKYTTRTWSSIACFALFPFMLAGVALMTVSFGTGLGYELGYWLAILSGIFAVPVLVYVALHAFRAERRKRGSFLLLLGFPSYAIACMLLVWSSYSMVKP